MTTQIEAPPVGAADGRETATDGSTPAPAAPLAPAELARGAGLAIEHRPLEALIPYARNARTHSAAQVALIAGSIREFGFTNPVLVDAAGGILAGHGRVLAARQLGLARVPVIALGHLSEAQTRAYILADNRLAERAGWDADMLALELATWPISAPTWRRWASRRARSTRCSMPAPPARQEGGVAGTFVHGSQDSRSHQDQWVIWLGAPARSRE